MLNKCTVCGGNAEADWGGVTEFYGKAEQDFSIECENDSNKNHNGICLSATIDANGNFTGSHIESLLTETWNKLNPKK